MKLKDLTSWYLRNERWISAASLISGFAFNVVALQRIDLFWENLWVLVHLGIAALGIVLINLYENVKGKLSEKLSGIVHFWLIMLIQFAFGSLLSTFLVFYFRSGTLSSSWPFLLMLAAVMVFNDLLKYHYTRLVLQISVLYVSIYSFAIFIVPVIFHKMGSGIFLLSGLFSLSILGLFLVSLWYVAKERFRKSKKPLAITIASITLFINLLYFTNIIPPIPLSLKNAGVFHSIVRVADGNYSVKSEKGGFWDFFSSYETFHQVPGWPVYVFSSIFSPTYMNTDIVHEWQHYSDKEGRWLTTNQVKLSIIGGRDDGFRTYSVKTGATAGLWRVNVKTLRGQRIGRIKFNIENVDKRPELIAGTL